MAETLREMVKKMEDMIIKLKKSTDDQSQLSAENKNLTEQLEHLQSECAAAHEECTRLRGEFKLKLDEQALRLKEEKEEEEEEEEGRWKKAADYSADLKRKLEAAEMAKKTLGRQLTSLQEMLKLESNDKDELFNRLESLQTDFLQVREDYTRTKASADELRKELDALVKKEEQKRADDEEKHSGMKSEFEQDKIGLLKTIEELTKNLGNAEHGQGEARKEILSLRQQITMAAMDKSHLQQQLELHQNKCKQMQIDQARVFGKLDDAGRSCEKMRLKCKNDMRLVEERERLLQESVDVERKSLQGHIDELQCNLKLSLKTHTELKDQICNLQSEVDTRLVAAQHQMKAVAEQQQQAPAAVAAAPLETTAAVAEKELSDIKKPKC